MPLLPFGLLVTAVPVAVRVIVVSVGGVCRTCGMYSSGLHSS